MAKVKLSQFEIVALLEDGKKLTEYLQKQGSAHIENIQDDTFYKFRNDELMNTFDERYKKALNAAAVIEQNCLIKKTFLESFSDYTELAYHEYKDLCEQTDDILLTCQKVNALDEKVLSLKADIVKCQTMIDYYRPWKSLDIPMSSTRTRHTSIFIGYFKQNRNKEEILSLLSKELPEGTGVDVEIVSSDSMLTCCVFMCHELMKNEVFEALRKIGFNKPEYTANKLVRAVITEYEDKIREAENEILLLKNEISTFSDSYDRIRFLSDFYIIQKEKYEAISFSGMTDKTIYFEGYVPERLGEELKFEIEKRFTAEMNLSEPKYEEKDVPVLVHNSGFASGVESITDMYAHPSNKDVDPNFIMSVFYYLLFGLMLSDAGYGLLMIAFAVIAKIKVKVNESQNKFLNFALYCGISTTVWGVIFGSFFGDLIQTVCTEFLNMETAPDTALWFNPQDESVKMLLFSFLFGIIHLFAGLAVRFFNMLRHKDIIGAFCDVVPVILFVSGFAVIGKDFIEPVTAKTKDMGIKLLIIGAVLIVLTAGRSAKNILGKLGGGLYGLYNTTTGYLGDILSYARLLALNLVTAVIAMVVNQLASMAGNILIFIPIFLAGHAVNFAINLIGTYVHTNRLQYVEFFSKFYEGGGRSFTPFRINSKHFKFKEDTINE